MCTSSESFPLQEQELRKSLFTSDIFGTMTRIAATVNSSGLAQTAGWRPLTFTLSLPWKLASCHSLLCSVPWATGQDLGQLTASGLPSIKSCKQDAQAVHPQRTLGWQLTLSLGLVDTEFPMVKAPIEAKTFLLSSLSFPLWPYPFWCEKFNWENCMTFKLRPNK